MRKGAIPGAGTGRTPQLGFHLSTCPECRAFRRVLEHDFHTSTYDQSGARFGLGANPRTRGRTRSPIGRLSLTFLTLIVLFLGWYLGLPLARAVGNVSSMTSLNVRSQTIGTRIAAVYTPRPESSRPDQTPVMPRPTSTDEPTMVPTSASLPTSTMTSVVPIPARPTTGDRPSVAEILADAVPPASTVTEESTVLVQPTSSPTPLATSTLLPTVETQVEVAGSETTAETQKPSVDMSPVPSTVATPNVAAHMSATPGKAMTVLVLGTDARPGEQFIARTDAIMVVRVDPAHNSVRLLSLPRDLWVPIPGAGEGRINTAFEIGEQIGEGAAEASATVGQLLGISIDHVLVMNFEGFRHFIDALDGIPVNVPSELYDPQFPTEDYGYTIAHFMPGPQMMDGDRALMYSRVRHPDSDFERMRRQQLVVLGIAQRLRDRGALRNLHDADQLTAALQPYIRTDMSMDLILRLIWDMRSLEPSSIKRLSADGTLLSETYIGGAAVLIGDEGTLHDLGAQLTAQP